MHTMGMSEPSLHTEFTDSLIKGSLYIVEAIWSSVYHMYNEYFYIRAQYNTQSDVFQDNLCDRNSLYTG